ncbi:uncharacterized protein [Palaemon carinicauda]|uniref:uncharacterized protein n=1 Tax=Palaemon carinicauda TaxID=392227 RepID=UPI0035B5B32B
MSPMKLAIMPHLLKELDFTVPIEPATLTFSMAKPILKPRWQSLYYPLKDDVWASILAMMIVMPAVFILVAMPPDAVDFYNGFKQSPSSEFRTLSERVTFVDSFKEGLGLAETSNSAYMYERRFMELMIARHFTPLRAASRLYVARQNVWPGYSAWPVIRDAPFKPVVDRCIQAFNEAGLIDKWGDMVVEEARRISRKKKRLHQLEEETETNNNEEKEAEDDKGSASQALTIVHMQGPLFLLLLGLAVAGLVFAIETVMYAWYAKR